MLQVRKMTPDEFDEFDELMLCYLFDTEEEIEVPDADLPVHDDKFSGDFIIMWLFFIMLLFIMSCGDFL